MSYVIPYPHVTSSPHDTCNIGIQLHTPADVEETNGVELTLPYVDEERRRRTSEQLGARRLAVS
jgi:hypothetical protein